MFVLESLLRILFQNLLFCFRCSFHFAPRPVTKCLFRLRLRIERGCELRPWLRPAGESETCPGRQTAGRRLSSCCDLSERHRGLLRRPHHRPWKVINIEATHIWVRVKDCPSPVKIKNAACPGGFVFSRRVWGHVLSRHVVLCMSCHVVTSHVMLCHVMTCHVITCHVITCHVTSCDIMSCHVLSCPVGSSFRVPRESLT